ncbi:MAG TPA: bifunctional adenosylcobinamide kinase/adenosylcobinamide-phosphate guanylyltransferase [Actinomycetota bacterium]|jgi:adenosyl cobinamide kinase/adenosyl cobinamide phosphate guanylyltransferase|nr:bifunctional adenosylcobinamide kinase/adenosylcobinamide-phosphate guanylyltransferase [Actinomycetota bacterium]
MALTFVLGGARSGKSALAVRLATTFGSPIVVVVVTAEARDDEMTERIRRHQEARPSEWQTVEAPVELAGAIDSLGDDVAVVLDCLTLWVSNALEARLGDTAIVAEAEDVARTLATRSEHAVVVSNEVGLGIVPTNALARRYRDVLGEVNAVFARVADRSYLMVAGRAVALAPPETA